MTTAPDIFLSYSREDQARAKLFAEAFKAAGFSVWWDVGLRAGEAYDAVTENALRTAKAVVVLWSKRSVESRWVRAEATLADRNKTLVPAMIEACERPIMFELTHTAELMHWQGDAGDAAFGAFLEDVKRFVVPAAVSAAAPVAPPSNVRGNLPRRLEPLIGREAELAQIGALLSEASLVTLTGPGGIGKTRLAIEAGQRAADQHADGAFLVELAPLTDASAIPGAIARAMGIELRADPGAEILERLRTWRVLIVLDNCEHLIEAASGLIERILQRAPEVRVLATSQEILGLEGERVVRLRSLGEAEAEALFLRAARTADPEFAPKPAESATIKAICVRLDGIALAIEMAAAHAPAIGCGELLATLDDRFRVLTAGRRTALPRQRTLQATLDWSHGLLTADEAAVFRRLAVFAGGCTLEAARGVIGDGALDVRVVSQALAVLNRKSLVVIDRSDAVPRYRLLETMRAYAQQKLAEAGETQALQRRHAEYFTAFFEPVLKMSFSGDGWIPVFKSEIDNLLAGLEWSFSRHGDPGLGCVLICHGFIVIQSIPRFADALRWLEEALGHADQSPSHVRHRLLVARAYVAQFLMPLGEDELHRIAEVVPPGSDTLARVVLISVLMLAYSIREGQLKRAGHLREELETLGYGKDSYPVLIHDLLQIFDISRLSPPNPALLRESTDSLVRRARASDSMSVVFYACAMGSGSEVPWDEDPDKAISMARAMVDEVIGRKARLVRSNALPMLGGRLLMALCERNQPGDIIEARGIVEGIFRRIGLSGPAQVMWLFPLAWMEGRRLDAVKVLGCSKRFAVFEDPRLETWSAKMQAALAPEVFAQALAEGAKMTPLEAFSLLLETSADAGGGHG